MCFRVGPMGSLRADEIAERVGVAAAGLHDALIVRHRGGNVRVLLGDIAIAEVGPAEVRTLPDGTWRVLRPDDDVGHAQLRTFLEGALRRHVHPPPSPGATSPTPQARRQPSEPSAPEATAASEPAPNVKVWAQALRARGVPVSLTGDVVRVAGIGIVPPPGSGKASKAAKRFVAERTRADGEALLKRARAAANAWPRTRVQLRKGRIAVFVNETEIAHLTRFRLMSQPKGKVLASGDLLRDEAPWGRLAAEVSARGAELAPRRIRHVRASPESTPLPPPVVPEPRLRMSFGRELDPDAAARAMEASRRLREERRVVPAVSVRVDTPNGQLVFAPLDDRGNPLEARFRFERGGRTVHAGLRLKRPGDPLTLALHDGDPVVADEAWAAALIVYAELTCQDLPVPDPVVPARAPQPRPQDPRPRVGGGRSRPHGRPWGGGRGTLAGESVAVAVRRALEDLRAVAGHLRRLPKGDKATPEALKAAEAAGIRVPPGHTWVRPHQRGGAGAVVQVAWPRSARLW